MIPISPPKLSTMEYKDIPQLPSDAKKSNGIPPYENEGYVLDAEINGDKVRWRYDKFGLKGFIVYGDDYVKPWKNYWFRENY